MQLRALLSRERALPYWIIFLGLVLRLYAAISHLDISHPDEHFQTLEPASKVVFGYGWLSWEWSDGVRSWLIPSLYIPVLWIYKVFGFNGGPAPIVGCRVMMGLLSTGMLWGFWKLLEYFEFKLFARILGLSFFALLPSMAAIGPMTLSDSWAMIIFWFFLPIVLKNIEKKENEVLAGFLLGLCFLIRIQMILWPVGMLIVLLFRRPLPLQSLKKLSLGYTLAVLIQGPLDWITWGVPFRSIFMNIKRNIFDHVAEFYGSAPWYDYFSALSQHLGFFVIALALLLASSAFWIRGHRFKERDGLILVPALVYFLVHSFLAHKEYRFLFPLLPVFFFLIAWGANSIRFSWNPRPDLVMALTTALAIISSGNVYSNDNTYPFDLSAITQKMREDGDLKNGGCLILVDHYFVWTRGALMIGAPIRYFEFNSNQMASLESAQCPYAISLPGRDLWFQANGGSQWKLLYTDNHQLTLWKRTNP